MDVIFEGTVDAVPLAPKIGDWDDEKRAPRFMRFYINTTGRVFFGSRVWEVGTDLSFLSSELDYLPVSGLMLSHVINGTEEQAADNLWRMIRSLRPGAVVRAVFDFRFGVRSGSSYPDFRVGFLKELQVLQHGVEQVHASRSLAELPGQPGDGSSFQERAKAVKQ